MEQGSEYIEGDADGRGSPQCSQLYLSHRGVRKGREVGGGPSATEGDADGRASPRCCQLQLSHRGIRKGGKSKEALGLLREMPTAGLTPDAFRNNSAIDACAKGSSEARLCIF